MNTVLVTGANGFVGRHLVVELLNSGIEVKAVGGPALKQYQKQGFSYSILDLNKPQQANKIDFKAVDGIIHLAGLAAVGPSFEQPMEYIETNMGIEINLFETVLRQNAKPRVLIVSSGSLYSPKQNMPLNEKSEVQPSSPYAISKLGQEQLAAYYSLRGLECIIARPFNHFGPRQGLGFIVPDLVEQVINFENGKTKEVVVGNLKTKRDYTDVRDIVRAYKLLLEVGQSGEIYNICSGKPLSGQRILNAILKEKGLSPAITIDEDKFRPSDAEIIYGSYKKIHDVTGWEPEISFETTIKDILEDVSSN